MLRASESNAGPGCQNGLCQPERVEEGRITIGTLSDDELLEIFSFYVSKAYEAYEADRVDKVDSKQLEAWCTLVRVCRRWRIVVFASSRRLNLRLLCTIHRPVQRMLDVWPTLPIVIHDRALCSLPYTMRTAKATNIIAALEHRDRVCEITLCPPRFLIDRFITMTQEPFAMLTRLEIISIQAAPILTDSFLGGYAPRLRSLHLDNILFPALPKFLLSTNDLVDLRLINLPHPGYMISPKKMVACLSTLTRLKKFDLRFVNAPYLRDRQGQRSSSPPTHVNLPALDHFEFHGTSEYIAEFVAQINATQLSYIGILLFNRLPFDISQVAQFISRIDNFKVPHHAVVELHSKHADVNFSLFENITNRTTLLVRIRRAESEWRFFSLAGPSGLSPFPFRLSSFESLTILDKTIVPYLLVERARWLELLQPFSAVKDLYLCHKLAGTVARAMRERPGESETLVLPVLQRIFVGGHQKWEAVGRDIESFLTERRRRVGPSVTAHNWATMGEDVIAAMTSL